MAKRKRLDPPKTDYLDDPDPGSGPFAISPKVGAGAAPIAGVVGDAAASAAAAELAQTLTDARAQGRMVVSLPLADVDPTYLVRDRVGIDPDEMETLVASIRARGQQTPIEVVDLGADATPRYGLISGWRRMHALRRIAEDGEAVTVAALLRRPSDAGDAYLSMVEENEIRVNLSYYERARIALKAVEQGAFPTTKKALLALFHAASRAKRSKIRSFLDVVAALDGAITFPGDLGERLGLQLSKALNDDPGVKARLRLALDNAVPADGAAEQKVIADVLAGRDRPGPALIETAPRPLDKPSRTRIRDGLYITDTGTGDVVLSGPSVDTALKRDLIDWLAMRGAGSAH